MSSSPPRPGHRQKAITAIYDIVWQASTHPKAPLSVQTIYSGSRIQFRKVFLPSNSSSRATHEYNAVLKYEGGEEVYGCDESLFQQFDILTLPAPATFRLNLIPPPPQSTQYISPLLSALTSTPISNNTSDANTSLTLAFTSCKDDDGYPFLLFHFEAPTEMRDIEGEMKMCAMGWAKRREYDDEVPGDDTCLSVAERERLGRRREIDMEVLEQEGDRVDLEEGEVLE
ncbi:hypothetical protein VTL71DRAFT_9598 [Oculimacula yallundae]|uniref:Uncharacterized protein n=1 Tax=Oculimacula yallundae TaxID=86028 RepID=A0ABR4BU59_9HELO